MKKLEKGDKLDKYRAHFLDGVDLKPEETEMLGRYRRAQGLLSTGFSKGQVKQILEKEYGLSQPQLYAIVRDSIKLFGDLEEVDKKGERMVSIEYYKTLAQLARKDGNIMAAIRAQENADKLMGLFDSDDTGMDPKIFLIPVPMEFSTDPNVLIEQQQRGQDTEDTEYEEVDEPA
ncbi:hypothetical protein LJY25_08150 [Hymenobacter sp. BT175]|uniref:hypothetical protein n=1 Tax=Hymenobacter translucens TaxID=2886507 RepID=UPI001D0E95C1|nr:hypothetical protein [Hymenobacter translucens]MCC2546413.1 hypothetical protein [Hymenobacter translucens]